MNMDGINPKFRRPYNFLKYLSILLPFGGTVYLLFSIVLGVNATNYAIRNLTFFWLFIAVPIIVAYMIVDRIYKNKGHMLFGR